MLNHKYLISAFLTVDGTKMDREFGMVDDYDLEPVRSVYDYPFEALLHVKDMVEQELISVENDFYQMVVI
jgi:hypothetical protein